MADHQYPLFGDLTPEKPQERPVSTDSRGLRNIDVLPVDAPIDMPIARHAPVLTPPRRRAPSAVALVPASKLKSRQRVYDAMVEELKSKYHIAIRKWRKHMSGVAYELKFRDGRIKRLITAPRPRSPVSASIFLHEVGHHAVGFRRYKPRCLEEYYVWQWAFREMQARGIAIDERVVKHYRRSMYHYVRMAKRRGLKDLHGELLQFVEWPG